MDSVGVTKQKLQTPMLYSFKGVVHIKKMPSAELNHNGCRREGQQESYASAKYQISLIGSFTGL